MTDNLTNINIIGSRYFKNKSNFSSFFVHLNLKTKDYYLLIIIVD